MVVGEFEEKRKNYVKFFKNRFGILLSKTRIEFGKDVSLRTYESPELYLRILFDT